jgi:hypothetical protein
LKPLTSGIGSTVSIAKITRSEVPESVNGKEQTMAVKWARVGAGFLLLIVVMGCGFPFINDNRQEARKSVTITIDLNRQQEFFDQLQKFAEANGFSIIIDTLPSSDKEFQIYMKREDVIISGASLSNEYQIGFSDVANRQPAPDSVFDNLVSQLEQYVSEVPGTTFLIRK